MAWWIKPLAGSVIGAMLIGGPLGLILGACWGVCLNSPLPPGPFTTVAYKGLSIRIFKLDEQAWRGEAAWVRTDADGSKYAESWCHVSPTLAETIDNGQRAIDAAIAGQVPGRIFSAPKTATRPKLRVLQGGKTEG